MGKFTLRVAFAALVFAVSSTLAAMYLNEYMEKGLWYLLTIFFVYLVGFALFCLWMDKNHTELISKINGMVKGFRQGNMAPTVFTTRDDELGELNASIHRMVENLDAYLKKTVQEKDQMETILASMVEGVLAFDSSGRLVMMNKTAEDMLGVTFAQAANHYFLEFLRNHQLADLLKRCLSQEKRQVIEVQISPTDPEYYRVYITPIFGKDKGAIMVLRNVTKVRLLEQMRSDFVANVSHELRTPLTSIKGYVETLMDGAIENLDMANQFLSVIDNETDRMTRLINDLLYLSQLETGRMEVVKKKIDAQQLLDKVVDLLKPVIKNKNIRIETEIHDQARELLANPDMMEQVLINLLENAVKYSYDGGVVRVEIGSHERGAMIRITDKGIGIPAGSLTRVFERFYRVDKARSRKIGGTGLGLSIVKHIVDRHRGQVQVESEEGKGTTFTITLPRA